MKTLAFASLLAAIATSASAQPNLLNQANNFLTRLTGAVHGAGGTGAAAMPMAVNQQTEAQKAAQAQALAVAVQAQIAADRDEARELIDRIVSISACALNDSAWNALNRYKEKPFTSSPQFSSAAAIAATKYHSRTKCLDVLKVTEWQKPARNALQFRVYLISSQSDEAKQQAFTLVKDESGQWLVRTIGDAYL